MGLHGAVKREWSFLTVVADVSDHPSFFQGLEFEMVKAEILLC